MYCTSSIVFSSHSYMCICTSTVCNIPLHILTLLSLCLADTFDMYNNWLQLCAGEKSNERTLNWGSRKHAVVIRKVVIRKCVIWILFPIAVQSHLDSRYFILERGGELSHAVDKNRSSTLRECWYDVLHAAGFSVILLNHCLCRQLDWCVSAMAPPWSLNRTYICILKLKWRSGSQTWPTAVAIVLPNTNAWPTRPTEPAIII